MSSGGGQSAAGCGAGLGLALARLAVADDAHAVDVGCGVQLGVAAAEQLARVSSSATSDGYRSPTRGGRRSLGHLHLQYLAMSRSFRAADASSQAGPRCARRDAGRRPVLAAKNDPAPPAFGAVRQPRRTEARARRRWVLVDAPLCLASGGARDETVIDDERADLRSISRAYQLSAATGDGAHRPSACDPAGFPVAVVDRRCRARTSPSSSSPPVAGARTSAARPSRCPPAVLA